LTPEQITKAFTRFEEQKKSKQVGGRPASEGAASNNPADTTKPLKDKQ
jgi:hypothetical protein